MRLLYFVPLDIGFVFGLYRYSVDMTLAGCRAGLRLK